MRWVRHAIACSIGPVPARHVRLQLLGRHDRHQGAGALGNSWDNNLKLAKLLDEAGIDFMLPIARWIGYGGETDSWQRAGDHHLGGRPAWPTPDDITVFATTHTAANHPVVVAKQLATIDQISGGRIGLNIVAGWNKPEYEALGLTLPDDHETRYGYAQEWFDIVKGCGAAPRPSTGTASISS